MPILSRSLAYLIGHITLFTKAHFSFFVWKNLAKQNNISLCCCEYLTFFNLKVYYKEKKVQLAVVILFAETSFGLICCCGFLRHA
jgi:hypothetical protein